MSWRLFVFFCCALFGGNTCLAQATEYDFSLYKKVAEKPGPTLLVIGGIQGDEPGGFNAASLLVTNYHIHAGSLWVVPNLNFESIIKRSRGIYGDMNRKFLALPKDDPEYEAVQKIKSIILDNNIDIVLNLHDGSGFYRPQYIDKLHNPHRWGQSIIIDQEEITADRFGRLLKIAQQVTSTVNSEINEAAHQYAVKNTNTSRGDSEMEKTLTYFAIRNNKPAFGVEVSKTFLTHERAYYHLRVVEAFMKKLGIKYERGFKLSKAEIKNKIDNNIKVSLYDSKIFFDMANARGRLGYVPLKKNGPLEFSASNPLVALVNDRNHYKVRYGNRQITRLHPEYFEYDSSLQNIELEVDGQALEVELGSIVTVKDEFLIAPIPGYRANVIGYRKSGVHNEAGLRIKRKDILKRFSIDRNAKLFRLEFYRDKKFCGMVLLKFSAQKSTAFSSSDKISMKNTLFAAQDTPLRKSP